MRRRSTRHEARLDFAQPATQVERQVRAFNPAPGAWFEYEGERIKVLAAEISELSGEPGTVLDHGLAIACGDGSIVPTLVQRAGRAADDAGRTAARLRDPGGREAGVTRFRLTIEYDGRPVHGLAAPGAWPLGPAGDRGSDRRDHAGAGDACTPPGGPMPASTLWR